LLKSKEWAELKTAVRMERGGFYYFPTKADEGGDRLSSAGLVIVNATGQ